MATCPHCGRAIQLMKAGAGQPLPLARFEATAPLIGQTIQSPSSPSSPSSPHIVEAVRRAPARPASLESDVAVPAVQATVTGLALGVVSIPVTIIASWHWTTPLSVAAVSAALSWLALLDAHRKLLWAVERITNSDLDGDGFAGQPATGKTEPPPRVTVEVQEARRTELDDLPGPIWALRDFCEGLQTGEYTFSERGAAASPYGATAFKELRSIFLERGWARWRVPGVPQQGVEVTRKGLAILRGIAET